MLQRIDLSVMYRNNVFEQLELEKYKSDQKRHTLCNPYCTGKCTDWNYKKDDIHVFVIFLSYGTTSIVLSSIIVLVRFIIL
jgi:hypothetical protein